MAVHAGSVVAMNPDTGAIAQFETDADAERAGYAVKLSLQEARELYPLNRHDRRAKLAQMRQAAKRLKPRR